MTLNRTTISSLTLVLTASFFSTAAAAGQGQVASPAAVFANPVLVAAAAPASGRASKPQIGAQTKSNAPAAKKKGKARAVQRSFRGKASWYGGKRFNGRKTASGDVFSGKKLSAAHPSLPLGTEVRVTNLENDRSTVLEINDRLPPKSKHVIDLSRAAAKELDFIEDGSVPVRVDVLGSNP